MDNGDFASIKRQCDAFLKHSTIEIIVPKSQDFVGQDLLTRHSDELHRTGSRSNIFFDEKVSVWIVLRSSESEQVVKDLLPHLELITAAHATNSTIETNNAAPGASKHDIVVSKTAATTFVDISRVGPSTHAVWSQIMHVTRPRARLQRPAVYFTANLALTPEVTAKVKQTEKHYLPSLEPLSRNVLEDLRLGTQNETLYLTETRITKVRPATARLEDAARPLRGATRRAFPLVPAVIPRLRCTTISGSVFASIVIEVSPVLAGSVVINAVDLKIPGAEHERIGPGPAGSPLQAGDELTLVYKIVQTPSITTTESAMASICLTAIATLEQGTEASLDFAWEQRIEFASKQQSSVCVWSKQGDGDEAKDGALVLELAAPQAIKTKDTFMLDVRITNNTQVAERLAIRVHARNDHETRPPGRAMALATTPEVQVGTMRPGECFETAIEYQALGSGPQDLGDVSIVDLDLDNNIVITELPDIVAG